VGQRWVKRNGVLVPLGGGDGGGDAPVAPQEGDLYERAPDRWAFTDGLWKQLVHVPAFEWDPPTPGGQEGSWELGWRFAVSSGAALTAVGLRYWAPVAQPARTLTLWTFQGLPIAQVSTPAPLTPETWSAVALFATGVQLNPGTYVVSGTWKVADGPGAGRYRSAITELAEFAWHPRISFAEGRYGNPGAFPASVVATTLYGLVNVMVEA
jgi:hypothetical protein